MIISVINRSEGAVSDRQLHDAIRAVNRQLTYDFAPYCGFGAQLRLEGRTGSKDGFDQTDMRGDAVLYVRKPVRPAADDGFHSAHFRGIPYGIVYLDLSEKLKEDWTVTLSHEALELVGDPELNLLVRGPHPTSPSREVFHWFEMCDAVQSESYSIDGVSVSNFVLPLYFTSTEERGGRNDFLGTRNGKKKGRALRSFSANPGGYITFFDPKTGKDRDWSPPESKKSKERLAAKKVLEVGRGHRRRVRADMVAPR